MITRGVVKQRKSKIISDFTLTINVYGFWLHFVWITNVQNITTTTNRIVGIEMLSKSKDFYCQCKDFKNFDTSVSLWLSGVSMWMHACARGNISVLVCATMIFPYFIWHLILFPYFRILPIKFGKEHPFPPRKEIL